MKRQKQQMDIERWQEDGETNSRSYLQTESAPNKAVIERSDVFGSRLAAKEKPQELLRKLRQAT